MACSDAVKALHFDTLGDLKTYSERPKRKDPSSEINSKPTQPIVMAQLVIPDAGKSGVSEKFLVPAPSLKPPEKPKPPVIIIEDSRELEDAGGGPSFFVKRIEISGNTIFSTKDLAPFTDIGDGMEMTLGLLMLMAQEISAFYSEKGYFLTQAYIPQQELKDGVVKIIVSEGKLDKIEVKGNKRYKAQDIILRMKRVKDEPAVSEQTLERTLNELNETMGVTVKSILRPGDLPGTSNLILDVAERPPYTYSFDSDNFGSRFTGKNRFGLNVSAGNTLFFGDQIFVRGMRSDLGQISLSPSYLLPLNSYGSTLKLGFAYSEQKLGESLTALNAGGNSQLYNIEVAHPVHRTKTSQFKIRLVVDYKYFHNTMLGETSTEDKILDAYVGFGGSFSDRFMGNNFFDIKVQRGIKNFNENPAFISRAGGSANNIVSHLDASRFQGTGFFNTYFMMKFAGHVADRRGFSPDIFSVGGFGSVRGFTLGEYSGDKGFTASLDYVIPVPWKLPLGIEGLTLDRVLSVSSFIDHGQNFFINPIAGELHRSIIGVGTAISLNIPKLKEWTPASTFSVGYASAHLGPLPADGNAKTLYFNGLLSYYY